MKPRRPKSSSSRPAARSAKPAAARSQDRDPVHVAGAVAPPAGPFSRPVDLAQAEETPLVVKLTATEAECAELARENDIPAIAGLAASFEVTHVGRGRFEVSGEVRARVTQICVVSLEPFDTEIVEPVDVAFASQKEVEEAEAAYARRRDDDAAEDLPEPPDPIFNGRIDLGAVAAEQLALALDPYPRKEGVEFAAEIDEGHDFAHVSPFAALAKLKQGPTEG